MSKTLLTQLSHRNLKKWSVVRVGYSTTSAIMVQSAILGFPRMGVNRDLKKATEACECPRTG